MFRFRAMVPTGIKKAVRRGAWELIRPAWRLTSGLYIPVLSASEWYIYNEVFVDQVYDKPILQALSAGDSGTGLFVVDLGANVGMFTLRVAHMARTHGMQNWKIIAVEGNPETSRRLIHLVCDSNQLGDKVHVVNALVGRRIGTARISQFDIAGNNRVLEQSGEDGVEVAYMDLESILPGRPIDLLKCDIEGSELLFIESYGDLLRRVQTAVFELHDTICDTQRCRALLKEAGFNREQVITEGLGIATVQFSRA